MSGRFALLRYETAEVSLYCSISTQSPIIWGQDGRASKERRDRVYGAVNSTGNSTELFVVSDSRSRPFGSTVSLIQYFPDGTPVTSIH